MHYIPHGNTEMILYSYIACVTSFIHTQTATDECVDSNNRKTSKNFEHRRIGMNQTRISDLHFEV